MYYLVYLIYYLVYLMYYNVLSSISNVSSISKWNQMIMSDIMCLTNTLKHLKILK